MSRSACVPLPTPGAPTRMMRAARLNSLVAIRRRYVGMRKGRSAFRGGFGDPKAALWRRGGSSKLLGYILQPHVEIANRYVHMYR